MPNWCYNEVKVKGPEIERKKFREFFKKNDYMFSCDLISKMPKSLNIPSGSQKEVAIFYALYHKSRGHILKIDRKIIKAVDPKNTMGLLTSKGKYRVDAQKRFEELYQRNRQELERYQKSGVACRKITATSSVRTLEELLTYGNTLISNVLNYGFEDWYEWCWKNWGVKWDVSDCSEIEECPDHLFFSFSTPWNYPGPVLKKASLMFPKLEFYLYVEYEDEEEYRAIFKKGIENETSFEDMGE